MAKRNATKIPLKASLKDFGIPTKSWEQAAQDRKKWGCLINKLKVQLSMKQRLYLKLKARAKQKLTDHHHIQYSPGSLALFATDSLELKLA